MQLSDRFTFPGVPARVVFGIGTIAQANAEVERLGAKRALVLSTPQQKNDAEALSTQLSALSGGIYCRAAMHTPVEVTEDALKVFSSVDADCLVAVGGGSTTGLSKAIAVRTGADQIIIPTTYAGSEMTDILGETAAGQKTTRRHASIQPETVIYDINLTMSLPIGITVTSALNSIAHAAEALYAVDRNPVISLLSIETVRAFVKALPAIAENPNDVEARKLALYGAWLGGTALGSVSMALHHKICHVLGGSFDTPHAETHAIMLPHTVGFNAAAVPELLAPLAEILHDEPGAGLFDLIKSVGAPYRLRELGISEADLDRAAAIACESPYQNPRPIDRDAIRAILQNAWEGRRPSS